MIPTPLAFSPCSVTGFFQPDIGPTPETTVSRGLAFCLEHGVTAGLSVSEQYKVLLNGVLVDCSPVFSVLENLAPEPVSVHLETTMPLGCGFGVSAAGALSAAFAIDRRFSLGKGREQLALVAHSAEVNHQTGIGDVAAQLSGGIVYRRCRTGPFDSVKLAHFETPLLHYRSFGPLSTHRVLDSTELSTAIRSAGQRAVDWLDREHETATLKLLFSRSLSFADETGLLTSPVVRDAINRIHGKGGSATMVMLGQSVLATTPSEDDGTWTVCRIDTEGTRRLA